VANDLNQRGGSIDFVRIQGWPAPGLFVFLSLYAVHALRTCGVYLEARERKCMIFYKVYFNLNV